MLGTGKAEAGDHEFKVSLSYLSETLTWSSVSWKERERARELCGVAIVYFPWDRGTRGQLSLCLQSWHLPWASVACAIFVPIWFLHHILVWNVIVILYGYCFSLQLRLFQRLLSASVQTLFTISRQLESSARICKCCLHTQRQHRQRWRALSPPLQSPLFSYPQVSCSLGTSLTDPLCLCSPPVFVCVLVLTSSERPVAKDKETQSSLCESQLIRHEERWQAAAVPWLPQIHTWCEFLTPPRRARNQEGHDNY